MTIKNNIEFSNLLYNVFYIICLLPFAFPNPFIKTDMQPYAAILGTLIIIKNLNRNTMSKSSILYFCTAFFTFLVSVLVACLDGFSINSLRGLYNYYAVFIIPIATFLLMKKNKFLTLETIYHVIGIWFLVGSIQFFFDRSFMIDFISGGRMKDIHRGVIGLASEPSFYGISCFYFMNLLFILKNSKYIYTILCLIMAFVYAQSGIGIMFIFLFLLSYILDNLKIRKLLGTMLLFVISFAIFIYFLNNYLENTRLYYLVNYLLSEGVLSMVLSDASGTTRFNAIISSLTLFYDNNFFPNGFGTRIGSGYGGFLCELGLFAIPIVFAISFYISNTFNTILGKLSYFLAITFCLFNNTQVGHPTLLLILGINLYKIDNSGKII